MVNKKIELSELLFFKRSKMVYSRLYYIFVLFSYIFNLYYANGFRAINIRSRSSPFMREIIVL